MILPTRSAARALPLAILGAAAPAHADTIVISNLPLDGFQLTTPIPDAGHGLATVTIDTDSRLVTITGSYEDMLGPVIAAHLHGPAGLGEDSPLIIFPLLTTGGTAGTFSGDKVITERQLGFVLDDQTYINIHTEAHTGGEIRGQIIVPAPHTLTTLALLGLGTTRRRG